MQRPDTPDGLFHAGNALTGVKGTGIPTDWLNWLLDLSVFFHGVAEPPDPALGDEGDFYICDPTRNMYGPKTSGEWGPAWTQGIPGPRGYRWYWGSGDPGEIVGQLNGDFYLDVTGAKVWNLAAGAWVEIGHYLGRGILTGARDPLAGDGEDGDWWINSATYTIYGPKAAGVWPAGLIMRGYRWYWGEGDPGEIVGQLAGDFYLDVVAGKVWNLAGGVWTEVGNYRGRGVFSEARDPLAGDGENGDWWINSATLTIYGPKAAGVWPAGQALRGPQGIQGPAGGPLSAVWADVQTINQSMALAGYDVIYLGDTSAGALFWTVPTAVGKKGRQIYLENTGTAAHLLTVTPPPGEAIEGAASLDLDCGMGKTIYSDGADWRVLKG